MNLCPSFNHKAHNCYFMFKPQTPLLIGLLSPFVALCQLYEQQFASPLLPFSNAATTDATYVSSSPNAKQLTYLGSSGAGSVIEVTGGKLVCNRTANGWGFTRGIPFSGTPSSMMISFDFENRITGGAATSAIVLAVGGGGSVSGANTTPTTNSDVHSRISFNYTNTNGEFQVRDIAGSVNGSTVFSGSQTVCMAINNSGSTLYYKAPNGSTETLGNDKFDVWIGTSRELNERDATTASQSLLYFKCISTSGLATVAFDNFLIDVIPGIPISAPATGITTASFTANWNALAGVTGYRVDVATDSNFVGTLPGYQNVYVAGASSDYLSVTGLVSQTNYYYRIRGVSQYATAEISGGNSIIRSLMTPAGGLPAPSLVDDTSMNTVDTSFDIMFMDDPLWRNAISFVKVNGTILDTLIDYEIIAGCIRLKPSGLKPQLTTTGSKTIVVYAVGYDDAVVIQPILSGIRHHQRISVQPTSPNGNGNVLSIQPELYLYDRYDNICTTDSSTVVTVSVFGGSWTLGGNLTSTAVGGKVAFTNLNASVVTSVSGARIQFSSPSLDSVVSDSFYITDIINTTPVVWANNAALSAWYTSSNWLPATSSGNWVSGMLAQFQNTGTAVTAGINMGTSSLTLGAIEVTTTRTRALTIGNSSFTPGVFTLTGTTINLIHNIVLRNASGNILTLQDNETGSGKVMSVVLGNTTNNIIQIEGAGGIHISSAINGTNPLTLMGNGSGVLTLSGANTYSGLTTVVSGTLRLNRIGGNTLPSNNSITLSGGVLQVSSDQTLQHLQLQGGILTLDAGVTLTINGSLMLGSASINGSGTIVYGGSGELIYTGQLQQTTTDNEWPAVNGPASVTIGSNGVILHANRSLNGPLVLNGTLTLGANQFSVAGSLSGNGRLRGSSLSRITFTGSGAVGILKMDQTSVDTRTLSNLSVNRTGSGSLVIGDSLVITDSLNLHNGILFTGGMLKLVSSATKTAVIAELKGTAAINGSVTMEQFVSSAGRRWRFVGSPFSNATFEDWRQELFITGAGTGTIVGTLNSNGFDASGSNQPGVYSYNETVAGDLNLGWEPLTNNTPSLINKPIVLGKGYRMFVRGDRSDWGRLTGTVNTQNAVTLNLTGTVHTGNFSFDSLISYTSSGVSGFDGWNLVANPYPCGYDWRAFRNTDTSLRYIDSSIWIYDATTGGYKSFNARSGGSLTNGIIPPGASFWIKANAANPSMVFKEQYKTTQSSQRLFKTLSGSELSLKLILDSVTSDIFMLAHYPTSLPSTDFYDTRKIMGTINIWSKGADGAALMYDARPLIAVNDTIHLWVSGGTNTYRLEVNTVPQSGRLYVLRDNKTNTIVPLTAGTVYSYNTLSVDSSSYGNRFDLIVMGSSPLPLLFLSSKAAKDLGTTKLEWQVVNESNRNRGQYHIERSVNAVDWKTIEVVKQKKGLDQHLYQYTDVQPVLGEMNYYRILYEADEKIYSNVQAVSFRLENEKPSVTLFPNPASQFVTIVSTSQVTNVSIKDVNGRDLLKTTERKLNISNLQTGLYVITVTDSMGNQSSHKLNVQH